MLAIAIVAIAIGWTPDTAAAETPHVVCSLPFQRLQPGSDCVGNHRLLFEAKGYPGAANVTAELLALDASGNVLASFNVNSGDIAQLASRINQADWKFRKKTKNTYEVYAPIPMLRVTADDGVTKTQAFCSNVPYLDVLQPANTVQTSSEGDPTKLFAAIPLVDPSKLQIKLDGVEVFAALGVEPQTCTAAAPCGGLVPGVGQVSGLIVDGTTNVGVGASNTVSMTVDDLSCGGHLFRVLSTQLPKSPQSVQCNVDDLNDTGTSSIFSIDVTTPADGAAGLSFPVQVVGDVCGGRPVADIQVNGFVVPAGHQSVQTIPGDGINTADKVTIHFDTQLQKTDLAANLANLAALGTFDEGSNRLTAVARDDLGNRTHDSVVFATGTTANLVTPLQGLSQQLGQQLVNKLQGPSTLATQTVTIDNAFVVGLSPAAVQKQFDHLCQFGTTAKPGSVGQQYKTAVTNALNAKVFQAVTVDPGPCAPNVTATPQITNIQINENQYSCQTSFQEDKIGVTINLPDVHVTVRLQGYECTGCDVVCLADTTVDFTSVLHVTGTKVTFDITENQLLPTTNTPPPTVFVEGTSSHDDTGGAEVGCVAEVCNVLITIATLGIVNIPSEFTLDISSQTSFKNEIAASKPDPVELNQIKVDESQVSNSGGTLAGEVTSVQITQQGIIAALKGTFDVVDPIDEGIQTTPGALLTGRPTPPGGPASVPAAPVSGAQDVFLALADDSLAMLFNSATITGKLKTECTDTPMTVGDLLPTDCEDAALKVGDLTTLAGQSATAAIRGVCHALRQNSCEALTQTILAPGAPGANLLTAIEQGACHGATGDTCDTIPTTIGLAVIEKETCAAVPKLPIQQADALTLCTRQDIPPRPLLIGNSNVPGAVKGALRMNDLSVALVLRRGTPAGDITDIGGLPPCFGTGSQATGACRAYAMCLDLDFNMDMEFQTCTDGKPGIVSTPTTLEILDRQKGVICGGSSPAADDVVATGSASSQDPITVDLKDAMKNATPPFCAKGFDLGGALNCADPKLFTIKTDGKEDFKDYLGVTCAVAP